MVHAAKGSGRGIDEISGEIAQLAAIRLTGSAVQIAVADWGGAIGATQALAVHKEFDWGGIADPAPWLFAVGQQAVMLAVDLRVLDQLRRSVVDNVVARRRW
jgi:hypothetical protein